MGIFKAGFSPTLGIFKAGCAPTLGTFKAGCAPTLGTFKAGFSPTLGIKISIFGCANGLWMVSGDSIADICLLSSLLLWMAIWPIALWLASNKLEKVPFWSTGGLNLGILDSSLLGDDILTWEKLLEAILFWLELGLNDLFADW